MTHAKMTQTEMTQADPNAKGATPRPWRVALSLFTVIPAGVPGAIRRDAAARALPWLPAVGALLAAIAAGAMLAVQAGRPSHSPPPLAAPPARAGPRLPPRPPPPAGPAHTPPRP